MKFLEHDRLRKKSSRDARDFASIERTRGTQSGLHARMTAIVLSCLPSLAVGADSRADVLVQYSISALLVIQTVLIIALLVQDRQRRRAKHDAERLHSEIAHAARLTMAGEMTASIAHEVTQPLSAILSNVETAELLITRPDANLAAISDILADIKRDDLRANEIVRRLRTLMRKRDLKLELVDINSLIDHVVMLIRADANRRSVIVKTEFAPGLPFLAADPIHLQQVFLNLMINAMDAMSDVPPTARWLEIQTHSDALGNVAVSIMDTGHGMSDEQLRRAFESFFTTKEAGMGLGLSIARSILQAHGGAIRAERRKNGGMIFHLTLPAPKTRTHGLLSRQAG
jgi:C4-dicarboxylate-specific signal transduction histidine kinase